MTTPAVTTWLAAGIGATVVERVAELMLSASHARRLRARGGTQVQGDGFGLIVTVHVLNPVLLAVEVLGGWATPGPGWPVWVALWLGAQALRIAAVRTLGDRWTTRVWVVPGEPRVTRGPYRWLAHPNYLAVVVELAAGPLAFGAWRTALAIGVLDAWALTRRIRAEDRALTSAMAASS